MWKQKIQIGTIGEKGLFNQTYTFWLYNPRFWHKNIPFVLLTHVESVVCFERRRLREWDGLTKLFIDLVDQNKELLQDSYIKSWYKISKTVCAPSKKDIHAFAIKWIEKFSDSTIDYIELVDHYMADDCEALGFKMDCGNSFSEIYGKAVFDYEELKPIINRISDIYLLGSAIYSRWRYFNHWAYDAASILEEKNRKWFLLALNRLMQLSSQ